MKIYFIQCLCKLLPLQNDVDLCKVIAFRESNWKVECVYLLGRFKIYLLQMEISDAITIVLYSRDFR